MQAAYDIRLHAHGTELLLQHCLLLDRSDEDEERPPARARLEQRLGPELAQLLLTALTAPQGRRGSSSPYTRT
jgi:hypothetical protein